MSFFNTLINLMLLVSPMTNDKFNPAFIAVPIVAVVALILLFITRKKK